MKSPDPKQLLNLQAQHERAINKVGATEALMSLDYGEKFCGVAIALDGQTVLPLAVVETSGLNEKLEHFINLHAVKRLIIGLPLSSDSSENHICEAIRDWSAKFSSQHSALRVDLINERFSSQATISPDKSRIDDLAAMQILQFYLDQHKG